MVVQQCHTDLIGGLAYDLHQTLALQQRNSYLFFLMCFVSYSCNFQRDNILLAVLFSPK